MTSMLGYMKGEGNIKERLKEDNRLIINKILEETKDDSD